MRMGRTVATERRTFVGFLLVAPAVIFLVAFFVVPNFQMVVYSISARSEAGVMIESWNVGNYLRLFDVDLYRIVLIRTLRVSFLTTIISIIIGYPLAIVMVRGSDAWARVITVVVLAPLLVNVVVRAYGWTLILSKKGLLNWMLTWLGLAEDPGQILYTEWAVVIASVHVFIAFMVLPLAGAISKIDAAVDEAARVLGASEWTLFRRITVPLSLPGLAVGTTLVFSMTAASFVTPQILGGNFSALLGSLIEQQVMAVHDWSFAAAIATVLIVIVLFINLVYLTLVQRYFGAWAPVE
ncbi:MAG: ABC transporter permease [Rhodospirillales bacterium]|jgi:putative spermidine/putrescine transport system permease protein|nr:ABC transporter permease [Rhodospirillales bacterium]